MTDPSMDTATEAREDVSAHEAEKHRIIEKHERDAPTDSHALAEESVMLEPEHEHASDVVRKEDGTKVSDLAWEDPHAAFQPQIMGMSHEEFWMLVRRFNYMVFRVNAIEHEPGNNLDMDMSQRDKTSPEKLKIHLARLYMSVIVGLFAFWKHIVRLRSWAEPKRTSAFLVVYAAAWLGDFLVPTLFLFLLTLVAFPSSREVLFPPIPPSLIDGTRGGLKSPPAGVMASKTSVTGAPENLKGEAIEEESHTVVNSLFKVIARFVSEESDDQGSSEDDPGPGLAKISQKFADAKANTDRSEKAPEDNDVTRDPMKHALEDIDVQPALDGLFAFIDTWERFANVLSPRSRLRATHARLMLSLCLLLPALTTWCLPRDMIVRGIQCGVGFVLFGQPVILKGCDYLNTHYPEWRYYCRLRNTILKGAPTNAQLTVTMLRIGERNKLPLLPSPVSHGPTEAKPAATPEELRRIGATDAQIRNAIEPDPGLENSENEEEKKSKPFLERVMLLVKHSSKRGVHVFHKVDKKRAEHGNEHAQERLDIGQFTGQITAQAGPLKFPARYDGTAGYVYITTEAVTPSVGWSSHKDNLQTAWTVHVEDIVDITKVKGMNPKKGQAVRWALDKQIIDGLILTMADGKRFHLSEVFKRNEVFNRLIAIGNQIWEIY